MSRLPERLNLHVGVFGHRRKHLTFKRIKILLQHFNKEIVYKKSERKGYFLSSFINHAKQNNEK